MKLHNKARRRGAAMVEYAILIAGVALIGIAAVSIFGHKTTDMVAAVATVLPGAHPDDNNPITSGHLVETAPDANGNNALDVATIKANSNTDRLGVNVGGAGSAEAAAGFGGLVVESN